MQPFRYVTTRPEEPWLGFGEAFNGFTSFVWVERYREPGEFEIEAPLSSGLTNLLTPGTLISHTGTYEICMVESQTIFVDSDGNPGIRISGRSLDAWVDFSVVGQNDYYPYDGVPGGLPPYILGAAPTWTQARELVRLNSLEGTPNLVVHHPADALMNLQQASPPQEPRAIRRESVYKALQSLLEIEDLGINVYRRHPALRGSLNTGYPNNGFPPGFPGAPGETTFFWIHGGRDLSNKVIFSYMQGDIESAEYVLTNVPDRTAAFVVGKFGATFVSSQASPGGYLKRVAAVDAANVDENWNGVGSAYPRTLMEEAGSRVVRARNTIGMFNIRTSRATRIKFKRDYDIGDIIRVEGQFNALVRMRVSEHTITIDKTGMTAFPSFTVVRAEEADSVRFPTTRAKE